MSLVLDAAEDLLPEQAWLIAERAVVSAVGAINLATAELVDAIGFLLDTNGWTGVGITSPEQWLCWKADMAKPRAQGLVRIAQRRGELPKCWACSAGASSPKTPWSASPAGSRPAWMAGWRSSRRG